MLVTHKYRGQPEWMDHAACAKTPSYRIWHSDDPQDQAEAKTVCAGCPVRNECLLFAKETGDGWAIMAGTTPQERGINRTSATVPAPQQQVA